MRILSRRIAGLALFLALLLPGRALAISPQTSSTLASTLITNARSYLNESTASFWTDAQLLVWINDGIKDIVGRTRCLETTQTITLVAGTVEYTITSTYIGIDAATLYDGTAKIGLVPGTMEEIGHSDSPYPTSWYEANGYIGIYPMASSDTAGYSVTVYLATRPTALTATSDTIPTPAVYDLALTLYVVAQAQLRDKQINAFASIMAVYKDQLDTIMNEYGRYVGNQSIVNKRPTEVPR